MGNRSKNPNTKKIYPFMRKRCSFTKYMKRYQSCSTVGTLRPCTHIISSPCLLLLIITLVTFILNRLTPMAADDFFFSCRLIVRFDGVLFPSGRIRQLSDLFLSLKNIYTVHSGRLPVLCTVQIFSLLPEKVFDVCNSVVFLLLVSAMVRFSLPHTPNSTFLTTMGGVLLLYTAVPAFGQNFLWMTGSVNYLWTMTITVWFLQPFLHPNQMPNFHLATIIWLILGLLSGWSMENQSAAACVLCAFRLIQNRQKKLPGYRLLVAGTVGQFTGFFLLLVAPGNYRRSAGYGQTHISVLLLMHRALQYTKFLWQELWWLILLTFFLMLLLVLCEKQQSGPALLLLLGAIVCHFSMSLSPTYPLRSMLGVVIFLSSTTLVCFNRLRLPSRWLICTCVLLFLVLSVQLPTGILDLYTLRQKNNLRDSYIRNCYTADKTDLIIPILPKAKTRFNLFWGDALSDLMQDPNNERNVALAYYYNVNTIRGSPDMQL